MAMILSTKYLHRMCELLADRLWFFRILLVWVFNYWIFPLAQNNNHLIIPAFVIKQIHNFVWKSGKHKHISVNTLYEQQAIVFGLLFIVSRATPYNSNNRTAIDCCCRCCRCCHYQHHYHHHEKVTGRRKCTNSENCHLDLITRQSLFIQM